MGRIAEQRLADHRARQQRRRRNQAGKRRQSRRAVRRQYGIPEPPVTGPPAPGYISGVWLLAERRYLYRYGWPLTEGWNTRPRPTLPKLNADGDHRHVVAMCIVHRILTPSDYPPPDWWIQTQLNRAISLELAAANRADETRRPLLLRSAACLACDGCLPDRAELIAAYTLSRYPQVASLRWPSPQELDASRQRRAQNLEQALSQTLLRISRLAGLMGKHYPQCQPQMKLLAVLARRIHDRHLPNHPWSETSHQWRPPDYEPGIITLASNASAVWLQRPEWPDAVILNRMTRQLPPEASGQ